MFFENKRFFPRQRALLVSLIVISWAVGAFFIALLTEGFIYIRILFYVFKTALALSALSSSVPYSTRGSWVFLILTFPYAAIPAYLYFRRTSLSRKEKMLIEETRRQKPKIEAFEKKILLKCNDNFTFLREIAAYSNSNIYSDTSAKYFSLAEDMFLSLKEELRNAKRFIFLEFYTVSAGTVLSEILDILVEKAGLGVEVKILYDEIGSLFKIPEDFAKIMKRSKIEARFSSSLFAAFPKGVNNRNHRKIIVIDGEIAYTGGINLADEYVYSKRRLGKWKDAGVRIEGVGVTSLTHTFLSDFVFAGGECDSFSKYYKYRKKKSSGYSLIFDDGPYPIYDEKISERMILSLIDASEKSFILTSPYLIFSSRILSAVRGAVKRGVKVKIIIPAVPDKLLTAILTHRYADRLCEIGARVYMYLPGFLHSKIYSADGKFAMCGTVNLDYRSLRHNFENGILFLEHPVIADIDKDLESILKECAPYKVKKKNPIVRLIGALLEIFAPLF